MEVVDYDKSKGWDIVTVKDDAGKKQGFIIRIQGESNREIKIICTPDELRSLMQGFQNVLE